MIANNKMTEPHKTHNYSVHRAKPNSPHWGFYRCIDCNKFITWIDKKTYQQEKILQSRSGIMWFGIHQGKPICELPQNYLEWLIINIDSNGSKYNLLLDEWIRREQMK